jgi:hypothetical protein
MSSYILCIRTAAGKIERMLLTEKPQLSFEMQADQMRLWSQSEFYNNKHEYRMWLEVNAKYCICVRINEKIYYVTLWKMHDGEMNQAELHTPGGVIGKLPITSPDDIKQWPAGITTQVKENSRRSNYWFWRQYQDFLENNVTHLSSTIDGVVYYAITI